MLLAVNFSLQKIDQHLHPHGSPRTYLLFVGFSSDASGHPTLKLCRFGKHETNASDLSSNLRRRETLSAFNTNSPELHSSSSINCAGRPLSLFLEISDLGQRNPSQLGFFPAFPKTNVIRCLFNNGYMHNLALLSVFL